ncbi:guanine nucleotide binding protein (G protein), alpha inhibiting activity polypeptide 2 [Reticulomyxa filosa]|uniref:Guanine nucleotide binding protein (G protein), alpha inhibiting activity polypeptide 2 n=1 Tax=Reticulomyxa filosa TaxID=46433 RepID=X6MEM2_RETFI|nr:guanine nucleotide binding protein (G protein), alpha inhibiting activity polypeptide 2 [Reticulomyxa filosa]|eukprot:ETO11490.1 guanine nucleotide binding protein (G protein), alpha inhibiting activity polypeptide 2 [Reticulomyxa filosa]
MGACCSSPETSSNRSVEKEIGQDRQQDKDLKKLLLLGAGSSGKTTIFKQLKCIHGDGFSDKDRSDYRAQIENQIIEQMQKIIIRALQTRFFFIVIRNNKIKRGQAKKKINIRRKGKKKTPQLRSASLKSAAFIEGLRRDNAITKEVGEHIKVLWKDEGIQATFEMRARLVIPDSCEHFFKEIDRIAQENYDPTIQSGGKKRIFCCCFLKDILLVRKRTTGIIEEYFTINATRFHIFDVGGQRNERKKWIHCFENVLYLAFYTFEKKNTNRLNIASYGEISSLSSYDERLLEDENVIVMHETLNLFEEICNSHWFTKTSMILFLNKKDLFEEKIRHVSLNVCWKDYKGNNEYNDTIQFIKDAFNAKNQQKKEKQIYIHVTTATNHDNIEKVFNDVQHIVINSQLKTGGLL